MPVLCLGQKCLVSFQRKPILEVTRPTDLAFPRGVALSTPFLEQVAGFAGKRTQTESAERAYCILLVYMTRSTGLFLMVEWVRTPATPRDTTTQTAANSLR